LFFVCDHRQAIDAGRSAKNYAAAIAAVAAVGSAHRHVLLTSKAAAAAASLAALHFDFNAINKHEFILPGGKRGLAEERAIKKG
jgi:hypothetical protein